MKNEIFDLPNPDSLIDNIPKTQQELQELINASLEHINNLPKSAQIQTSQAEVKQYHQIAYNHEGRQNLESIFGLSLVLMGALIHIKIAYGNKQNTLPKHLENSKYTIRGFIEQWNLNDNDF
jgi:hypothetical protein